MDTSQKARQTGVWRQVRSVRRKYTAHYRIRDTHSHIGSLLSAHYLVMVVLLHLGGWFVDHVGERASVVLRNDAFVASLVAARLLRVRLSPAGIAKSVKRALETAESPAKG